MNDHILYLILTALSGFILSILVIRSLCLIYRIYKIFELLKSMTLLLSTFQLIIAYLYLVFIGVGNFGTSIRHRAKFVIALILIAAPFFPKLIFLKKN